MFESFGQFTTVFSLLTFIAVLRIVFQKQIDELENKYDEWKIKNEWKIKKKNKNHKHGKIL